MKVICHEDAKGKKPNIVQLISDKDLLEIKNFIMIKGSMYQKHIKNLNLYIISTITWNTYIYKVKLTDLRLEIEKSVGKKKKKKRKICWEKKQAKISIRIF